MLLKEITSRWFRRNWIVAVTLALILGFAAFVRLRLIEMPLERDEGEYAYAGQLMLQGIPPYKLAYNMKLPGTYVAYAGIMAIFGQTIGGIHLGLIVVNILTALLLFQLARQLFGEIAGLAAAAFFSLLSLTDAVFGLATHATHFVTLFAVAGALILYRNTGSERKAALFWSGLLFGLSFLMKQQGIFFGLFGFAILVRHEFQRRPQVWRNSLVRLGVFLSGTILPFALACGALALWGVFARFWFWTFAYASQYAAIVPLARGWLNFKDETRALFQAAPFIWLLTAMGVALSYRHSENRRAFGFALGFAIAGFATACPGLYFREHYFIPFLPGAAIFAGAAVQILGRELAHYEKARSPLILSALIFLVATGHAVFHNRALFFQFGPDRAARELWGDNPFSESVAIARYIRENSTPRARIAVLGSEPQIYFYSKRHSATGYIYTYPLMEPHRFALTMQQEMIKEVETNTPEYVVLVNVATSWLAHGDSNRPIFEWFEHWGPGHYRAVGLIDIQPNETVYRWNEKAIAAIPRSKAYVRVFKRTDLF